MKRDYSDSDSNSNSNPKLWERDPDPSLPSPPPMDELLAVLGYKVRSSDMADVALKLEQLEMALSSSNNNNNTFHPPSYISHLSSDAVHYNPSDISSWLQSMLSELNPSPDFSPPHPYSSSDYDLSAIAASAAVPPNKRFKSSNLPSTFTSISSSASTATSPHPPRPVVLVDSQETGVRLVHALMACAEAVQQENFNLAGALVKHVSLLAASQPGAMRKVATYFAEALAMRIYGITPRITPSTPLLIMTSSMCNSTRHALT